MSTKQSGDNAEAAVAEFLGQNGYKILERNWRTPYAEIDIVAERDKSICFVEVKYRRSLSAGDGFDSITAQKLSHMNRAAEAWILAKNYNGPHYLMAAAVTDTSDGYEIDIREI